ncbi:MAG: tripartite tricarboxylate transporter TctB family protein [Rhodospirillaceae bacterium]|nr:tripartite tricarboxylate transporter TctB family protein [Rhodospirillaceae bacterium]
MTRPMDKADFVFSLVLTAFGLGVVVESLRLPRLAEQNINPYTVPGLLPGILGALMALCGIALLVRSALRGGWRLGAAEAQETQAEAPADEPAPVPDRHVALRLGVTVALTLGYAVGLFGHVPFGLATVAFIFLFTTATEWIELGRRPPLRALASAAVIALFVGFGVQLLFERVFYVRLPG